MTWLALGLAGAQNSDMRTNRGEHWSRTYERKAPTSVSWYRADPAPSLAALDRFGADASCSLIDVGGGASTLVDALLDRGWPDLTVLDIAPPALEAARSRIGPDADRVRWLVEDVTEWTPARRYDVWHDRAVFHFLTDREDREAYRRALLAGLAPGGLLVIATFAPDGPEMCSGLPVQRYDAAGLALEFAPELDLLEGWREEHITPAGGIQRFQWCAFRRPEG